MSLSQNPHKTPVDIFPNVFQIAERRERRKREREKERDIYISTGCLPPTTLPGTGRKPTNQVHALAQKSNPQPFGL